MFILDELVYHQAIIGNENMVHSMFITKGVIQQPAHAHAHAHNHVHAHTHSSIRSINGIERSKDNESKGINDEKVKQTCCNRD